MSKAALLTAKLNLIEEVAARLVIDGMDCSGNLVLFPGKRPGHFLRKSLAEKIGKSYLPPSVVSMDEFVEKTFHNLPEGNSRTITALDAAAILFEIHLASPSRLGESKFLSLDDFLPLGMKFFSELEELMMADLSLRMVKEKTSAVEFSGLQPLYAFYEHFYDRLDNEKLSTRATMYRAISRTIDAIDFSRYKTIVLAGFYSLARLEQAVFRGLYNREQAVALFHDGPGIERQCGELGISPERKGDAPVLPKFSYYQSADTHGQVLALNGLISERLTSNPGLDERSVIVLPAAETLFPLIQQPLSLLEENSYNISLGYPVSRTPVAAFLNCLLEVVTTMHNGQLYAPAYFKFALHPYVKNIRFGARSDITRILFHTIEEQFWGETSRIYFSFEQLLEMKILSDVRNRLKELGVEVSTDDVAAHLKQIHEHTLNQFLDFRDLGDLANKTLGVLEYIHDHSTARAHPYFTNYVETLVKELDGVAGSLLAGKQFGERRNYFTFLKRFLSTVYVAFEGTPLNGLQVLGFLETRNLSFDTVYILDMNDDRIPGEHGGDMLLPQAIREGLGLPTYKDAEASMAYYFYLLTRGAKEVHCFFIKNDRQDKSRFLEQLLWQRQKEERSEDTNRYIRTVRYEVSLVNKKPGAIEKMPEAVADLQEYAYNSTALDMYLECELKFYYAHVMNLAERDEVAGDIEKSDIGVLVHSILKQYFQTRRGIRLTQKGLAFGDLERIIDVQFRREFGDEPMGAKFLIKRQIKTQLKKFLDEYQLPIVEGAEVIVQDLEVNVSDVQIGGYQFTGRIDRIETRNGKTFVLDYKTGSHVGGINFNKLVEADRETWSAAIGSLQLPFYAMLYERHAGVKPDSISPVYVALGRNQIEEIPMVKEEEDFAESYRRIEWLIFKLLDEITDARRPFSPPADLKAVCPHCPYKYICGTQWAM
jgi:RecB family exonuclease